jgi:hypothetical protein
MKQNVKIRLLEESTIINCFNCHEKTYKKRLILNLNDYGVSDLK